MGGRQLVQVVVGSETGAHLPVKGIPHVHGVVAAAAGQTAERVSGQSQRSGTEEGNKTQNRQKVRHYWGIIKLLTKIEAILSDVLKKAHSTNKKTFVS